MEMKELDYFIAIAEEKSIQKRQSGCLWPSPASVSF